MDQLVEGGIIGKNADARTKRRLETMFARQAAATPDSLAVLHRGRELSYSEIDLRANRLAHYLRTLGVGAETLVGVCLERSPDVVVVLLAILKAGGAYVPLDPGYPEQRLEFMLRDSAAPVLVTRASLASRLAYGGRVLDLDAEADAIAAQPGDTPATLGDADNLAYVIYTSGSTGQPKGVMLSHTASAFIDWAAASFTAAELSRVAATTSICFDPSVFEVFAPLCTGGTVVLKENILEPFAADERPTLLNGVPSAFAELARAKAIPDSVRIMNVGGETFKPRLVQDLYSVCRVEKIYNHYGPTEATTCTTVALIPSGWEEQTLPIGKPIAGARVHVLDPERNPVAAGQSGELYVAGETLARGYLNNPELTRQRFVPDPFGAAGGRMYRTGDEVRWSAAGELEFLGRIDGQVKLRGFRIEPGEIEAALLRLPEVSKAAVMIRPDQYGEPRLVAYVETAEEPALADVRRYLGAWLPEYMLPSLLVALPVFPLTPSGKIDRNALPVPAARQRTLEARTEYLTPVEEIIADTFQEVLGGATVGGDDNFFDLGGDSLLAVGVILRLETLLGQPISPGAMFHGPTPKLLAALRVAAGSSHLTALQPEGDRVPLFVLPDIFGRPLSYASVARHLAPHRPVYGLSPGPLEDAAIARPAVDTLTAAYLAEIRKLQPHGPYQISGYSSGGVPAFDLARALEAEGEEVLLIVVDSAINRGFPPLRTVGNWAYRSARVSIGKVGWKATIRSIYKSHHFWLRDPRTVGMKQVPDWVPRHDRELARALLQAEKDYEYQPFGGSTVLFRSLQPVPVNDFFNFDGLLGWRGLFAGPVREIEIDTDHFNLMREPFASEIAKHLETVLR